MSLRFLFDEPLSNLDAELRVTMRIEIARLHKELGNTMVYVTHDQTEAMTLADKIVVLRDGKIEQVGSPREVYENPDNTFVAGFIGSPRMNLLKGTIAGKTIDVAGSPILAHAHSLAGNSEVVVGLRPEHLDVVPAEPCTLAATVDFTEYLGGIGYLYCKLADGQSLTVEQREGEDYKAGDQINLSWRPEKLRLFSADGMRLRPELFVERFLPEGARAG